MQWDTITATQDRESFEEDYYRLALAFTPPKLPERTLRLGAVQAGWFPVVEGTAHIFASGGTPLDRLYACQIIEEQLAGHGIKRAQYSLDYDHSDTQLTEEVNAWVKTADARFASWADIEIKAKKLLQEGKVHILRNSAQYIASHVEGEHGDYECEIQRIDPNSKSITMWNCSCLAPGTPIVMYDGSVKCVEEIVAGDIVLTATGHAGMVSKPSSRQYQGDLYGFKIEGSTEVVWMTGDHKIPTPDIDFKEARAWGVGDFTYMPEPTYPETHVIDVASYVPNLIEKDGWLYKPNKLFGSKRLPYAKRPTSPLSPRQKPIPARIDWDAEFARISGLYVAEGIATPRGELRWSFNAKTEQHLADEVIYILTKYGLDNARKMTKDNCVTVAVQSKPMADLFCVLFGTGSKTKRLHLDVMGMPIECLQRFFAGWFEGDGYEAQNYRNTLSTASSHLAMQARLILARLGTESVIRVTHNNSSPLVPNGTDLYVLSWRRNGGKGLGKRWYEDRQVHQRMYQPEQKHYIGPVYNFEVIDYHTYVIAPGIASANCPWDQFSWGRTRRWKRLEGRPCKHILATFWLSQSMPLDEEIGPGSKGPQEPQGGSAQAIPATFQEGAPQGAPAPGMEQVPGGGTGMVPPAGTPGPQQPGMPNQMAPMPQPSGPVPGQAPEPQSLLPQYPHDPALQPAINPVSVPGQKPQTPLNPLQNPGGTFSSVIQSAEQQFTNGQMIQLKNEDVGTTVGLGAGQIKTVPMNSIGEVLGVDPITGMVHVYYAGPQSEAGPLQSHGVTAWHWPSDVIPRADVRPPGPAVRRR